MGKACISAAALYDWHDALARAICDGERSYAPLLVEAVARLQTSPDRVELDEFVDLLERIGRSGRSSLLPWSTGQAARLPLGEDIGRAILGSRSLGSALHWLCQYFPLVQDASCLKLDVNETWTHLSYKILDPMIWPRHEDAMYSLGMYAMLVKAAAPDAWSQVQVTVEAEQEQVHADLSGIVNCGVVYGGSANVIRFPTSIINAPIRLAPPCAPDIIKKLSAELTKKHRATPVSERARQLIYAEMNEGCVSQEYIARELGISGRTLRRRLAEEGLSFQSLLDECRMEFAAFEFRTRRELSLSDMALKLGYSEHSTFSRAFSRWAGMPPQRYRQTLAAH